MPKQSSRSRKKSPTRTRSTQTRPVATATQRGAVVAPVSPAPTVTAPAPRIAPSTIGRRTGPSAQEFNPDYTPIKRDLGRLATLAGSFLVILIALSFFVK